MSAVPLQPVPPLARLSTLLEPHWKAIDRQVYDGYPHDHILRFIEAGFREREQLITSNTLHPQFDWIADLHTAKNLHQIHLDYLPTSVRTRDAAKKHYLDLYTENGKYVRDLAANGMKTLLLLHGAVALGALNIIAGNNTALLLAAKFALCFSLIGIIMLIVGQIIFIESLSTLSSTMAARLVHLMRWKKILAIPRFLRRHFKWIGRLVNFLIYGSAVWFCVYVSIIFIIIAN